MAASTTQATQEPSTAEVTEPVTMTTSSMVPETTATTVSESSQEVQTTQQPTEVSETVPETTVSAVTESFEATPTEASRTGYTIHMGKMPQISGTIVVGPAQTPSPTEQSTPVTEKNTNEKSINYEDSATSPYLDYDSLSEEELFGYFPDKSEGNYGGFLGPIRDYTGYPEQAKLSEEEFDKIADPEPIAELEYDTSLGDFLTPSSDTEALLTGERIGNGASPPAEKLASNEALPVLDGTYGAPPSIDEAPYFGSSRIIDEIPKLGLPLEGESSFVSPLALGETLEYGTPLVLEETPSKSETPVESESASDPATSLEVGTAVDLEKSVKTSIDGYGAPRTTDIIFDYGPPSVPDEELGFPTLAPAEPTRSYENTQKDTSTSKYQAYSPTSTTQYFGGFGDYSPGSATASDVVSEAPSTDEDAENSEKPAAGSGLLRDNIKRLKEEMRMM